MTADRRTPNEKSLANLTAKGKGRVKGVPNKATTTARQAIAMVADGKAEDFKRWLDQTAEGLPGKGGKGFVRAPDPAGAARLYLAAIEYHIPKLARTELTGKDGSAEIPVKFIPADKTL